ncbi:hypothetical protein [Nannocystis sp. SCPEA4]|uniref:hypothetical protein n=1 Tax=Nannocystis sp. SCPEA4 TaxID=2996787 RepID=UPI00226F269C|nr:hypothetical protein [Nannocystis sp. SCPEA4]MCY1060300.1 hypothetical protein [Nannocystis sp. SCPEA4]
MRPLGLLLCLTACTLDNPAFFVTDGGATQGSTTGPSTDPTRPTTGPVAPTTSTSEPGTTASSGDPTGTSDVVTTSPVSDTDVTTDVPGTSTSTTDPQPMTTTTTDPNSSDTGPMMCVAFDDPLGPMVQLQLPNNDGLSTDQCIGWTMQEWAGELVVTENGFTVFSEQGCGAALPVAGFHFAVEMPDLPPHNNVCVKVRFGIHADHEKCVVSHAVVTFEGKPIVWGSFGRPAFADVPLQVGIEPATNCGCPDCCAPAPGPELYSFEMPMGSVPEGGMLMFKQDGMEHMFYNLRSHIHSPACQDPSLANADWLHLDWMVVQLP